MPPPDEHAILLKVLAVIAASVPFALYWMSMRRPRAAVPPPVRDSVWDAPVPPPLPPPPSPAAGSWWERRDAWFALVLAGIVAGLMGPLASLGMTPAEGGEVKIKFTPVFFAAQLVFQAALVAIVVAYLKVHRRFNLVTIFGFKNLTPLRTVGTALLWIIPGFFAVILAGGLVVMLMKYLTGMEMPEQMIVQSARQMQDPATLAMLGLTLCIGAPVMEELIFRGLFFTVAARFIHRNYALLASALFFAVIHNNLMSLVPLTMLGILFGIAYERTRTLAVPILMHAVFNGIQFLLLLYGDDLQKAAERLL